MRFLDGLAGDPGDLGDIRKDPNLHPNHIALRNRHLRAAARIASPTLRSRRLHTIAATDDTADRLGAGQEAFAVAVTIPDPGQRMRQFDWLATQPGAAPRPNLARDDVFGCADWDVDHQAGTQIGFPLGPGGGPDILDLDEFLAN
ncbi:hypothetical protein FRAHR75_770024 [Frankia sp. Hr75.2]|nr:hypothetical protein FRAHR75_770024 [Frankia sp. Hr75.2]